jgi:hypothetical protein
MRLLSSFSPVHIPSGAEKAYLVVLADWWKKEQGTVHEMEARAQKERRIADVSTEKIGLSRYKKIYVDVIVEVSNFTNSDACRAHAVTKRDAHANRLSLQRECGRRLAKKFMSLISLSTTSYSVGRG